MPEPTPTALPTPTVFSVDLAAELAFLREDISTCAAEVPDSGVLIFESLNPAGPQDNHSVTIRSGYPIDYDGSAFEFGEIEFFIVSSAGSRIGPLTESQVRDIYAGIQNNTNFPQQIAAWIPLQGTYSRLLLDNLMDNTPYSPDSFLAPGSKEVVEILANNPMAISVLPSPWLTSDLEVVHALGEHPVLALTTTEPTGTFRDFLGCLQNEIP